MLIFCCDLLQKNVQYTPLRCSYEAKIKHSTFTRQEVRLLKGKIITLTKAFSQVQKRINHCIQSLPSAASCVCNPI